MPIVGLTAEPLVPDTGTSTWCIWWAGAIGPPRAAASAGIAPRVKLAPRIAAADPTTRRWRGDSSRCMILPCDRNGHGTNLPDVLAHGIPSPAPFNPRSGMANHTHFAPQRIGPLFTGSSPGRADFGFRAGSGLPLLTPGRSQGWRAGPRPGPLPLLGPPGEVTGLAALMGGPWTRAACLSACLRLSPAPGPPGSAPSDAGTPTWRPSQPRRPTHPGTWGRPPAMAPEWKPRLPQPVEES